MGSDIHRPSTKKNRQLSTWNQLESSRPLPVRFQFFASRRTNKALCPCLIVQHRGINVIRILDPEHKQPYISLDSIFLLSNRTIPLGILEFDLSRDAGDYDLTLAGLEPREAIWVPLKLARQIADQVGLLESLSTLLDWDNRHIWSLDEGAAGIVHNWRALQLDADSYSTGLLIQTELKNISLLPKGQQVRTLISQDQRQGALNRLSTIASTTSPQLDTNRNKYEQRLLRWSVLACEELLRSRKDLHSNVKDEEEEQRFNIETSDMLLLFDDYLKSLQIDTTFEPVSIDSQEILTEKKSDSLLNLSTDEVYRRARVHIILIHHLWSLTTSQITSDDKGTIANIQATSIEFEKVELQDQMKRIEASCKRSEWAVSELLARKEIIKTSPTNSVDKRHLQLPYVGLLDARIFLALIVGIVLGSMTSRM